MFGPNVKADERGIYYHHREEMFHVLLSTLEITFAQHFGLEDYRILFITGSGTTANESVIFSFRRRFHFLFEEAEFGNRLRQIGELHQNHLLPESNWVAYPLYETSISRLNLHWGEEPKFVDMVSSFPYFMPPKNTLLWTTVSSKQLGAYPVLGIIGIHKSLEIDEYFQSRNFSCLNIKGHLYHRQNSETLHTAALSLYYDLLQCVKNFRLEDFKRKLNERRKKIVHYIGIDNVMGSGPVVTFHAADKFLQRIADQFSLYRSKAGHQVFLWSGTDPEYESFYRALERR